MILRRKRFCMISTTPVSFLVSVQNSQLSGKTIEIKALKTKFGIHRDFVIVENTFASHKRYVVCVEYLIPSQVKYQGNCSSSSRWCSLKCGILPISNC